MYLLKNLNKCSQVYRTPACQSRASVPQGGTADVCVYRGTHRRGAAESLSARADFQVRLKLKSFKISPLHSGTCMKVTHQTQSVLPVESPTKANASPLNSLMLRCGKRTGSPLLSQACCCCACCFTKWGLRFTFPLERGVACSIKNIVCNRRCNCIFQYQPCCDAGGVLVMTNSRRLGRDVKGIYNLSIICSVYKQASVVVQKWSNNKQGRHSLGTSSPC